jgi:hypothetical protein
MSSSISKKNIGRLPLGKILRPSSICKKIEVIFHFQKIKIVFHCPKKSGCLPIFLKDWGCLPFSKILRSSSISKISKIFQFGSYSTPVWLLGQVLQIPNYFTTSPDGRPAGWPGAGGNKIKANSAQLS